MHRKLDFKGASKTATLCLLYTTINAYLISIRVDVSNAARKRHDKMQRVGRNSIFARIFSNSTVLSTLDLSYLDPAAQHERNASVESTLGGM